MPGEDQTGEPRSRHAQPLQHAPGQDRAQRMERNVDQVVAGRIHSEQVPLDPEQVHRQRYVCREPEPVPTVGRNRGRIVVQKVSIVPDETAVPGRRVGEKGEDDDHQDPDRPVAIVSCP